MKLSAFTIARNARIYDFPLVESILSVIDLVDEFVVALGKSDDDTEELVMKIDNPKLKIIHTVWDLEKYKSNGAILAQQTDVALQACTGDWAIYIQADEVLHEDSHAVIRAACQKYLNDSKVEGFLLQYVHLYADYKHYISAKHYGYPREIRIVRPKQDLHSWRDAQSFRIMPEFDGITYTRKENTRKLNCILLDAYIYHYGWNRHPVNMAGKIVMHESIENGQRQRTAAQYHDYGNLSYMPKFKGSHPKYMKQRIAAMDWQEYLRFDGPKWNNKKIYGLKYRVINFLERYFMFGEMIGGFKNYHLIGRFGLKKR